MYTLLAFTFLCLFIHQSVAVTLQDFTPRQTNLKGDCETIYTSTIDGCQSSDFENSKCSTSCISGLESIGKSIKKSCTGQGSSDSIIAVFLNGQGVSDLCPNAASSAASTTSQSKTPTIGSSTLVLSSTSVEATGIITDTSSTSASASARTITAVSTATVHPVEESAISVTSTVGTALAFASSTPASVIEAATETSTSSSTKKAESTSSSEGGSPFDTSGASTQAVFSILTLALTILACIPLL